MDDVSGLKSLGSQRTAYPTVVNAAVLETFPNRFPERDYLITHETSEFSSLCPKTGQPDFARITITYVANRDCVESKSLKLYLFSYRNEGSFMETIVNKLLNDLVTACKPRRMTVTGAFNARGGVTTTVVAEYKQAQ